MYPRREVFTNSPLALVAAEIRFTDAARLRQQTTLDAVTLALEERFPYAEALQQTDFNIGQLTPIQPQSRPGVVLKGATSTESITLVSSALTYETTAYSDFGDLLSAITIACAALVEAKVRPAIQRIGLRYIDEVRVPEVVDDVRQWTKWIDGRLMEHLAIGPEGVPVGSTQGLTTFDLGGGKGLNFRFAALNQGPVVTPQLLVREVHPVGPFFVLDFDGYQDFSGQVPTPLDAEVVSSSLSAVHVPCGATFQQAITEDARKLFRGMYS